MRLALRVHGLGVGFLERFLFRVSEFFGLWFCCSPALFILGSPPEVILQPKNHP